MAYGTRMDYVPLDRAIADATKRAERDGHLGFLYRVDDCSYASSDEWGDYSHSSTHIELYAFAIRKRFAHPTVKEALVSLIARRTRQASIYEARMLRANGVIYKAQDMLKGIDG